MAWVEGLGGEKGRGGIRTTGPTRETSTYLPRMGEEE